MATFVKDDNVVVPFPFSDLTNAKRRPTLVLAELTKNDFILCLITSQDTNDSYTTLIETSDFETGSLNKTSYAKSNRIFTANEQLIAYKAGTLAVEKTKRDNGTLTSEPGTPRSKLRCCEVGHDENPDSIKSFRSVVG